MMGRLHRTAVVVTLAVVLVSGCGWKGVNSLPLPGTEGGGPNSFEVKAELPDVTNIKENSLVRVGDVTVGNITDIELQGWHALVTMRLNGDVDLPANATAKVGQTSLLGSLHVELAPPADRLPEGRLGDGSVIPLSSGSSYPTTEETFAALSALLNGGGLGQVQEITTTFAVALAGRTNDLRSLLAQLDQFIAHLNDQRDDIIDATASLNDLAFKFADQRPVVDTALRTVPDALSVLADEREKLADTVDQLGKLSAVAANSANQSKDALVQELRDLGPVLESLANAGPAMTRSLSFFLTYPWPNETLDNWFRGDYANLTLIMDLTLSRLDAGFFTGTRWEGALTELEMQWGRTIGQMPSPYTAGNPLIVPYHFNESP